VFFKTEMGCIQSSADVDTTHSTTNSYIPPEKHNNQISLDEPVSNHSATRLWGVSLEVAAKRSDPDGLIPLPIKKSILYINDQALDEEGIYRVSAAVSKIRRIREEFDSGRGNDFAFRPSSGSDAAGIVVNFIGNLPEPLFTAALNNEFVTASERNDLNQLKALIARLPPCNLETLRLLCQHLYLVSQHSDKNKMDVPNLARCFGPEYNKVLSVLIGNTSLFS
jgi:hypothetical protein